MKILNYVILSLLVTNAAIATCFPSQNQSKQLCNELAEIDYNGCIEGARNTLEEPADPDNFYQRSYARVLYNSGCESQRSDTLKGCVDCIHP